MKIAILHFAAPPIIGGVESVISHHARLMSADGHQVSVLAGRGAQFDNKIEYIEIPLIDSRHPDILELKTDLDRGVVPKNFGEIEKRIHQQLISAIEDFDVLFVHNVFTMAKNLCLTSALRRIALELKDLKVVAWHHDLAATSERYQNELHPGWPWDLMNKGWEDISIHHVAVSQMRSRELTEVMKIESDAIDVIPSGINSAKFLKIDPESQSIFETIELWKHFPRLLLPVRITRRKNIEMALEIAAELSNKYPELSLIVTGPPGAHNQENQVYFRELIQMRNSLGLDGAKGARVIFLAEISADFLPDYVIADLYNVSDALLMTSTEEGFGIPIIEAALSRIPIFCSELEPFKEIAGETLNYFSFDDTPQEIASSIASVLERDTTHRLRQKIYFNYSWDSVFKQLIRPLLEK